MNVRATTQAQRAPSSRTSSVSSQQSPTVEHLSRKWENLSKFEAGSHYLDKDFNLHTRKGLMGVINAVKHFFGAFSLNSIMPGLKAAMVEDPGRFQGNKELIKLGNRAIAQKRDPNITQTFQALFSDVAGRTKFGRAQIAYSLTANQRKLLDREGIHASSEQLSKVAQGMKDVDSLAHKELKKRGIPTYYSQYFTEHSKDIVSAAKSHNIPLATYIRETVRQVAHTTRSVYNINNYIDGHYRDHDGKVHPNVPKAYKSTISTLLETCYDKHQKQLRTRSQTSGYTRIDGSGKYSAQSFETGHAW